MLDGLMLVLIADIRTELLRLDTRKLPYLLIPRLDEYAPRVGRDHLFALLAGYDLLIRHCKRRVVICLREGSWLLQNPCTDLISLTILPNKRQQCPFMRLIRSLTP